MTEPRRRRTDPESSWRPDDDDDSLEATAKRARMALANDVTQAAAIADLATAVRPLTKSVTLLTRVLLAGLGVAATAIVLVIVGRGVGIFDRLRLDPPAQVAPVVR